jgi:hypothetical protein
LFKSLLLLARINNYSNRLKNQQHENRFLQTENDRLLTKSQVEKELYPEIESGKSALEKMSNKELRAKVKDYCNRILQQNSDHKISSDQTEQDFRNQMAAAGDNKDKRNAIDQKEFRWLKQDENQYELDFREQFLVEGNAYRSELFRRLGPQPQQEPGHINPAALDGYVDDQTVDATGEYLEWIASKLPNSE